MADVCVQTVPAFRAFESQLKELCIKEFPCGLGEWVSEERKRRRMSKA
jgi:hypothetical protein